MTASLGSTTARRLGWLSPLSFLVFISSMLVLSALPLDNYHSAIATVEWTEMIAGTLIALASLIATIWESRRVVDRSLQMNKTLAIAGSGLWAVFWIIALGTHRGSG